MNHQSFERWLYEGETIEEGHPQMLAPAPGFAARWKDRWDLERLRAERRRALGLGILSALILLLLSYLIAQQAQPLLEAPWDWVAGLVRRMTDTFATFVVALRVGSGLVRVTPPTLWAAFAASCSLLALSAVLALNRIFAQQGVLR